MLLHEKRLLRNSSRYMQHSKDLEKVGLKLFGIKTFKEKNQKFLEKFNSKVQRKYKKNCLHNSNWH